MIEEEARVVSVDGGYIYLLAGKQQGCSSCASKDSCSTTILSPLFKSIDKQFKVFSNVSVKPGDTVILAVEEKVLLAAAVSLYAVPILVLIVFSLLGQQFAMRFFPGSVELFSIVVGLFAVAVVFAKRWIFSAKQDYVSGIEILRVKHSNVQFNLSK